MDTMLKMIVFMLLLNIFMWISQSAITQANPEGQTVFNVQDTSNSPISRWMTPNGDFNGQNETLPTSDFGVSQSTGNWFSDTFSNVRNWVTTKFGVVGGGVGFILDFFTAPYKFFKIFGFPLMICTSFAILWYVIGILVTVMYLRGQS